MRIYILNFEWAWQAKMLSYTHIIWQKCLTSIDLQMMLQGLFAISIGFKFRKISQSIPFQVSSVLWTTRNTYLGKQDERTKGLQEKMEKLNNSPGM